VNAHAPSVVAVATVFGVLAAAAPARAQARPFLFTVTTAPPSGVEAFGEDLEGFWDGEEAEGGAKLFVGPSVHVAPAGRRIYGSVCGGPILYATHSDRMSGAPRPLGATGNGYTLRLTVGYRF
jgi:hypothetical protein